MFFLLIPFIIGSFIYKLFKRTEKNLHNRHVVITGGSSGIGKSLAVLCIKQGSNVTIIGRNIERLNNAITEMESNRVNTQQLIHSVSLDVSDNCLVKKKFKEIEEKMGPIYMLANCAGTAICGILEDIAEEDVKTMLNTNYLGTLYPIQAVLRSMKTKQEGIILITASQAALIGIYGMSVYSGTKFALRGLAESLHMEVKPYNISVTLALPPDTDTPGFIEENKSKPKETVLISGTGGLYKPIKVAAKILKDTLRGNFLSSIGFESFLLTTLTVGMTSFTSISDVILEAILLGPCRIISCFYLKSFHKIIKQQLEMKEKNN